MRNGRQIGLFLLRALFAAFATGVILAAFAAAARISPAAAVRAMVLGSIGDSFSRSATLVRTTPILLTGLAVGWAFRAGLFNIGAEGQLLWGGLAAGWVGCSLRLTAWVHLPLALAAGALAGAVWAWPAAVLKSRRGTPEVVTTLLLSFIAELVTSYLAAHPLHDPAQQGARLPDVRGSAQLPLLGSTSVHAGLLLALGAAALLFAAARYSRSGFELRVVGRSPEAARSAGLPVREIWTRVLLQSGALAGLAGAVQILGVLHYFQASFSPGFGFEGIPVAILGANEPLGIILAALFWGALSTGAIEMESSLNLSRYLVAVIQALVVLLVAVRRWPVRALLRSSGAALLSMDPTPPEG